MFNFFMRNRSVFSRYLILLGLNLFEINSQTSNCSLSQESSVISNLNEYLDLFENCLVHLINYAGYDLLPPNVPLVLSRYYFSVWEEFDPGENQSYVTPGLSLYFGNNSKESHWISENVTFPQVIRSNTYNWRCRAQFYLNPPQDFTQIASDLGWTNESFPVEELAFRTPYSYANFWNNHVSFDDAGRRPGEGIIGPESGNYHILLEPQNHDRTEFQLNIDLLRILEPQIHLLVLTLSGHEDGSILGPSIQSAGVICQYCDKYRRILVPLTFEDEPLSRVLVDNALAKLSEVNNGVPWDAEKLNIRDHDLAPEMQQQLVKAVQKGSLKFTNVREYIQGSLGGPKVKNFLGKNHQHYLHFDDTLSIEILFLALAVPNLTVNYPAYWCYYSADCDRMMGTNSYPRAAATLGFKLFSVQKTPEEYLQFITCGYASKSGISFEGFVSAYDTPSWIFMVVLFLGLGTLLSVASQFFLQEKMSMNTFFMGVKILLEQGDDIVSNVKQRTYLYWICGTWLLASMVFSNGYKGQNITAITSPLKLTGITDFSQLLDLNFTILTNRYVYNGPNYVEKDLKLVIEDDPCLQVVNVTEINCTKEEPNREYQNFVYKNAPKLKNHMSPEVYDLLTQRLYKAVMVPINYNDIIKGHTADGQPMSIVHVLSYCNKTAYVGWADKVDRFQRKLTTMKAKGHISKGVETHLSRQMGWDVENWENPRIMLRLKMLTATGITDLWRTFCKKAGTHFQKVEYERAIGMLEVKAIETPLALTENTATVFVIFVSGLGTSTLCFSWEVRRSIMTAAGLVWVLALTGLKSIAYWSKKKAIVVMKMLQNIRVKNKPKTILVKPSWKLQIK